MTITPEESGGENRLSERQSLILKSFFDRYRDNQPDTSAAQSEVDQAQAHFRTALHDFEIDLRNPQELYVWMAGLAIGTERMVGMIEDQGLTPIEAAVLMQGLLAWLHFDLEKINPPL
jgi:hypothetical protein